MVKIAPSLLAANFLELKEEIIKIKLGGASWLHYDVMDGHFVPNISFGSSILNNIKNVTDLYLDVHLMITNPKEYIDSFIDAGASLIVFHYEAVEKDEIKDLINYIKGKDIDVGLSIKPDTKVSAIEPFLELIDVALVMSIEPGFGGQAFMPMAIEKIVELKKIRESNKYSYLIEVDGGINTETAKMCKDAGIDVLVAGSYIFNHNNYKEAIESLL